MRRLWCESAILPGGVATGVSIDITQDRISAVTPNTELSPDRERLIGVTAPGFANAHSHAFHRALRGRTHHGTGDFWTWRSQMYQLAEQLNPDNYFALARAVFAEMLLAGFTCVGEFHYLHHQPNGCPYDEPNAMGAAIIAAASDAGIRLTLLDTCYLQGGFGLPLEPCQQRFSDTTADRWLTRVAQLGGDALVRIGAALHSVRAVPVDQMSPVVDFAARAAMPLHAHVSEQPLENAQTRQLHGCSPTELLAGHGALSARFTAVHATHIERGDIELLRAAETSVCFCPTTERDLADGVGPSVALAKAGVRLCVGSDSHAVIDPFEEMRAIELNQRLITFGRGNHPIEELFASGSVNGYRSLGWEGGAIAPGMLADLCTVSLKGVRLAGTNSGDLVAALLFAAAPSDVQTVIVGGATLVSQGRHVRLDVGKELSQSISVVHANA